MTVFLNDSIAVAGCPKIVLVVDGAAVGDIRDDIPVAEAIYYIAVGTEFDERGHLLRNFRFLVCNVIPTNNKNVILCVHTHTAHLSVYPVLRQRLWPVGINDEFRDTALRLHAADDSQSGHET